MKESVNDAMSPPYYVLQRKLLALFGQDPEIRVRDLAISGDKYSIMILVNSQPKADALKVLIKSPVEVGNFTVNIIVYGPDENKAENNSEVNPQKILTDAFTGNPLFSRLFKLEVPSICTGYCLFKKQVVQCWVDNICSPFGVHSDLAENLARKIIREFPDWSYCTEVE